MICLNKFTPELCYWDPRILKVSLSQMDTGTQSQIGSSKLNGENDLRAYYELSKLANLESPKY